MGPMRENLVIARVGANSLHAGWLVPDAPRNWDLLLSPYQALGPQSDQDCTVGEIVPGPKWSGLRQVLADWDGWRGYEHVWLPDDDIRADPGVISSMFDVAGAAGLQLFAPALGPASYFGHFDTMHNRSFYGRRVGFVEIMVPGFSTAALEMVLPTLEASPTGWGWGLDSVWPKLLGYEDIAVLDGLAVDHTRPIGAMRDSELFHRLLDESDTITRRYGCQQVHTTFGAFGPDLGPLDLTAEELLVELVRGWDYHFDRDPRLLSWVAEFQRQHFETAPYPVEGTPTD